MQSRPLTEEFLSGREQRGFAREQAARGDRLHEQQLVGPTRFLIEPRAPLSNNAAERAIRGPVVGRTNHYGSKSQRGTEVAALFYTLIESARLASVDPVAYLRAAAKAAIRDNRALLPHEFRAAAT